ncbi:MAG: ribonuclease J [Eubacteriales bacterium]|nr:ribonuclease J [Eubacteriales bacterium]
MKKADGLYVPPVSGKKIRVIPLGGLEQIGMNITVIESENSIVIVDCGMAFPNEEMLGIDLVIPDITYLREHADKIEGFFITHGHEDHIGALPYILRELNVPVFSTRLTRALIENKLREHGLIESAKLNTVSFGDFVSAGDFSVEFIKTNHSIQDAAALAIHSPAGVILHTGDFKVDYTPVFGDTIDLQRFAELGKQGVLALLCDSTNAARQGFTMSERTVGHTFDTIFNENKENRIIVATFASNVDRVQQVITTAEKYGRKVIIDGRSMINIIGAASELGYIRIREGTLLDISEIKNYPDDKIVLIVTGSQGESMAALSRMAMGQHRKISLSSNDVIVLSSTPIPGNEKAVSKVINELSRRRTKVIYQDTHVSGHACAEELKLIYALVRPRFSIPVHGELRHRLAQKEVAVAVGMPKENCFLIDTGDVAELSQDSCRVIDKVQAGPVMVDGLGVGDVGNVVLKDRQSLSQNGIMIVSLAIEKHSAQIIAGPEIVTRGLIYVKENEEIIEEARNVVLKAIDECRKYKDMARVRNTIRNELSDYIWRRMKRTPIILPVISEV